MRDVATAIIVLVILVFIIPIIFNMYSVLFGFIDYTLAMVSKYIPMSPDFMHYYYLLREHMPDIVAASMFTILVAAFVYTVVAAQRKKYQEVIAE